MFDWKYYLDHYKDLRENGIISEKQAFDHFTKHGRNEGRICCTIPSDFDWKFYTTFYKDSERAGIDTEEKAICH